MLESHHPIVPARPTHVVRFLAIQGLVLAAGIAWGAVRWQQLQLERALPELRARPITIAPTYDFPVVVSDEQLARVLTKLRPRNLGAATKLNHIDHALRFWGTEAKFDDASYFSGEQLRGVLTDHRKFAELFGSQPSPLLIDAGAGVRVRVQEGPASSSHVDHTVAGLSEVGTPLDFPVVTSTRETTYRALIEQMLRDFKLNQVEYEWSALTMAAFLPPRNKWIDSEGQEITFDRLAERLMREEVPRGVCFGNHRLHALAMFLRIDDEHHILSPAVRTKVVAYLTHMTELLVQHQHSDGYWDGKWPQKTPTADTKESAAAEPLADRILATGHALEWWAFAPPECLPPRETLAKAGQWLVRAIDNLTPEQTEAYYTFLTHAGRTLALWRGKLPHEVAPTM